MHVGVTLGDASGVGPEILLRTFEQRDITRPFVTFGDVGVLEFAKEKLGLSTPIHTLTADDPPKEGVLNVIDAGLLQPGDVRPGEVSAEAGRAAVKYVEDAVHAALAGKISAICTLPINKASCRFTYPDFQGHTEFIAEMCGVDNFAMMLATPELIGTNVSTHVSLAEAIQLAKKERILEVIRLTRDAVQRLRPRVKIAVAGLNPHAGEHGAFGREEIEQIEPAVAAARAEGIDVHGPLPPDTLFMQAVNGLYDAVVCMYHDQCHIPLKLHGFHHGVNITIGLPIIRTSVDHGTAFDIAYQGKASTGNFVHAFDMAVKMAGG